MNFYLRSGPVAGVVEPDHSVSERVRYDHRIPLEICLTSNIQTKASATYETHPLKFYYDYGLRVTLNTDNRLMSETTMTEELYLAAKYFNLDLNDIKDIILSGFKSAFLPNRTKALLLNLVTEELTKF